jgi:hypothetical protein
MPVKIQKVTHGQGMQHLSANQHIFFYLHALRQIKKEEERTHSSNATVIVQNNQIFMMH